MAAKLKRSEMTNEDRLRARASAAARYRRDPSQARRCYVRALKTRIRQPRPLTLAKWGIEGSVFGDENLNPATV